MHTFAISLTADVGGKSQKIAISATSAQTNTIPGSVSGGTVLVTPDVACFYRGGVNPTAVNDGSDQYLAAGNTYRIQVPPGWKLAFMALTGSGNVYVTYE